MILDFVQSSKLLWTLESEAYIKDPTTYYMLFDS